MPNFSGKGEVTTEEHLADFYAYVDTLNIEHEDVWIRVFFQSLESDVKKWFRSLTAGSIIGIETLDDTFLRKWGDNIYIYIYIYYFLYYIIEFGAIKRKEGESVSDFSKIFNKMYKKIPTESSLLKLQPKSLMLVPLILIFFIIERKKIHNTNSNVGKCIGGRI